MGVDIINQTVTEVEKCLSEYDIITFDIFDTLITRCILRPTDVFAVVEAQAKYQKTIKNRDFAYERSQAEQAAYKKYGESANFQNIYEMLQEKFLYTDSQREALMKMELETESRLVIPRLEVRQLVIKLLAAGKRIVLCSDMYLSSNEIRKLLVQCGYPDNLELWISNEKGATKGSGEMWRQLFAYLPSDKKIIHVGDNEQADYRNLKQIGKEALLIDSGLTLFEKSELYGYLSKFAINDIGNSLILGFLINKACFNSPFKSSDSGDSVVSVWGGAAFACFMDFLVKNRDDSQLLFVTREGYLLKPMYERYCHEIGIDAQCNTLFYSSRAATTAATITSEKDMREAMQRPRYQGTLGQFVKSRMNFDLSFNREMYDLQISLPDQEQEVFRILKPYFPQIFQNGNVQKIAYQTYISDIRQNGKPLTVVDVGYNGTIQYTVSKILPEKVGGLYMFLNDGALPQKMGCSCSAIANPRDGQHPIYDNLLFLEAVMQVPYGQLQRMTLNNGCIAPAFNADANFSEYIPVAQEAFCGFVEWMAGWKREVNNALKLDFALAEAIWVCLLRFGYLPNTLLKSFWLADDFCGQPMWRYDDQRQEWLGSNAVTPLAFTLVPDGTKLSLKYRIKTILKKHIPYFAYEWASKIWIKYIK